MQIVLILISGFPMLDHALTRTLVDTANRCAGRSLIRLTTVTIGGGPVASAEGPCLAPDAPGTDVCADASLVLFSAGAEPTRYLPLGLRAALQSAAARGATLGGLGQGAHVLSALGYLDGHRAVLPDLPEPQGPRPPPRPITNCSGPFVHDRARLTASVGIATLGALLDWLARQTSPALASAVARATGAEGVFTPADGTAGPPAPGDTILNRMTAVMGANLAAPLPLTQIAATLGVSPKQLRRRCQRCTGEPPGKVYLTLRLDHARRLVQETTLPVADIATAAGFESPSSFTRSFRDRFHAVPRALRVAGHAYPAPERPATALADAPPPARYA